MNNVNHISNKKKLGDFLIISGSSFVLICFILGIIIAITKSSFLESNKMGDILIFNLISILIFIFPIIWFNYKYNIKWKIFIENKKMYNFKTMGLLVLLSIISIFFLNNLNIPYQKIFSPKWMDYFNLLEQDYVKEVNRFIHFENWYNTIITFLLISVMPAIVEELYFRGGLQPLLIKVTSPWVGILLTSVIFSLVHISILGFLDRMIMGLILGYVYYFSKNILCNIYAHFINNFIIIFNIYLVRNDPEQTNKLINSPSNGNTLYFILLGIALIITFHYFKKNVSYESTKNQLDSYL